MLDFSINSMIFLITLSMNSKSLSINVVSFFINCIFSIGISIISEGVISVALISGSV